jgi:hypothetical protein
MYSYDLLIAISLAGMALGAFQLIYMFVTWRANEDRKARAIVVMQEIYRKARKVKLRAVLDPLKSRRRP